MVEKPKTQCDCGWLFPRHFRLNARVRDEADIPETIALSFDCPQCGSLWHMKCPLKFAEQALAV